MTSPLPKLSFGRSSRTYAEATHDDMRQKESIVFPKELGGFEFEILRNSPPQSPETKEEVIRAINATTWVFLNALQSYRRKDPITADTKKRVWEIAAAHFVKVNPHIIIAYTYKTFKERDGQLHLMEEASLEVFFLNK